VRMETFPTITNKNRSMAIQSPESPAVECYYGVDNGRKDIFFVIKNHFVVTVVKPFINFEAKPSLQLLFDG